MGPCTSSCAPLQGSAAKRPTIGDGVFKDDAAVLLGLRGLDSSDL